MTSRRRGWSLLTVALAGAGGIVAAQTPTSTGPSSKDLFEGIHVVVGPSARALEPIAVLEPRCPKGGEPCATLDRTITRDLTLSGYFKVLDRASFLAHPAAETLVATSWPDWANIGAKYLVKCEVTPSQGGVGIECRLFHVPERKAIPVKGQSHAGVAGDGVRRAAHAFVNGVIEAVTGAAGIFGSRIVVSVKTGAWERAIVAMEMDGSGRRTVVSNGSANMFPRFAPGGGVLYTSFLPGFPQLYLDGKRLTHDEREYRGAAFSPDGRRLCASLDMGGQSDLVLLDPKTGAIVKNLTNSPWDEVTPSWSPDGSLIAFVSNRAGNPQVHVIGADGSGERRVTMAGAYNTSPRFGPQGRIVFAGMDEFRSDLFVVDLQGNISRLTQDQGNNKDPAWSPDGRHIAFLSNRDGGWKVWIMTEDGRYQFPITDSSAAYATPDWGW